MKSVIIFLSNFCGRWHFYNYFFILLTACLLLPSILISCSPYAQNRRRIPEAKTADQIIIDSKNRLGLTDDQEVKIRPIIEEQVKKRNELIKKYQGQDRQGMDSLRDELQDLRISTESQLQYFLTNEQMITYGEMQNEEDQRICKEEGHEEQGQKARKGRGRRSGNFIR
jgi:hypothetical protein